MIVRTRAGSNRELRSSAIGQWRPQYPTQYPQGLTATTGQRVTVDDALGLPAVLAAVRLVAETVASLPLEVWQGRGAEKKRLDSTWQHRLLHDAPSDEQSAFDFWLDVAASVETFGNAYIRKVKDAKGRVITMFLLDPWTVRVYRNIQSGEKTFWVRPYGPQASKSYDYTASEILHIRGFTTRGSDFGVSPIGLARNALSAAIERSSFEGHLYANNASPPGVISVPGKINDEQAEVMVARWKAAHSGPLNAGNPAVLGNGAEWKTFGLPLKDVQFIEANGFLVEDVARMFSVPASLLNHTTRGTPPNVEQDSTRFLNFGLNPRLKRIEQAVFADPDFFGVGSKAYVRFASDEFIRADAATQAQIRHFDVQSGVLLPDEARADVGRPPLPDGMGKIPQITPVGGSPNPLMTPAKGNDGSDDGASSGQG